MSSEDANYSNYEPSDEERSINARNKQRELQILSQIEELGNRAKKILPEIEVLYERLKNAHNYGPSSYVKAQQDLQKGVDILMEVKDEQIRLAKQLDDNTKLVRELEEQKSQVRRATDKMLYGSW